MISAGLIVLIVLISLLVLALLVLGKLYFMGGRCKIRRDLSGKVIIITGAYGGVGQAAALELAKMNATLILTGNDQSKMKLAVEDVIKGSQNPNVSFMELDLSDLGSIREFAQKFKRTYGRLDILINKENVRRSSVRRTTKNNFEAQFGVNYLGHYYLTSLLLDTLKRSGSSRVINVSSIMHHMGKMNWEDLMLETSYGRWQAYCQSLLANVLFTTELQRRLSREGDNVKAVTVHPGLVKFELWKNQYSTWFGRNIIFLLAPGHWYCMKTPQEGAQTILECALMDYNSLEGGAYYADCKIKRPSKEAQSVENAKRLWEESEKLVRTTEYSNPEILL